MQSGPHTACEFGGVSVLASDKACLGRTRFGATKSSVYPCQHPHGSAANTPCATPCLPVFAPPPSPSRGWADTGDARTLWLLNVPGMSAAHIGGVCHSGCWHLCFLLCWAQPLLASNGQANVWRANNAVALWPCVTQIPGYNHTALSADMAFSESMGHGQGEPWR